MLRFSLPPAAGLLTTLLLASLPGADASAGTVIRQFGITWTFDRDYPFGQFANGDYWVVGPARLVSIDPASVTVGERTINGSMINPAVGKMQGYDSATYGRHGPAYDPALNVALGLSDKQPLTLKPGSSLVSTISEEKAGNQPQLRTAAILTILAEPAPPGSFRPPPTGADKTLRWNRKSLDLSLLRSLPRVRGAPSLRSLEASFERPWIEQNPSWTGRFLHPSENQPDYGRDMASLLSKALLSLQLDYTNEEKERLLIRLVQYGIDVYGAAREGAAWMNDGGHNHGRKMPLLLAATLLGDDAMLAYTDGSAKRIFQEDQQTWYVAAEDVQRPLHAADGRTRMTYLPADVDLAEWGEKHATDPGRDGRNWDIRYRTIVGGSILGHVLTARLMGVEPIWNWPALFDYSDRYWQNEKSSRTNEKNAIGSFVHAMWNAYRHSEPPQLALVERVLQDRARSGATHATASADAGPRPRSR